MNKLILFLFGFLLLGIIACGPAALPNEVVTLPSEVSEHDALPILIPTQESAPTQAATSTPIPLPTETSTPLPTETPLPTNTSTLEASQPAPLVIIPVENNRLNINDLSVESIVENFPTMTTEQANALVERRPFIQTGQLNTALNEIVGEEATREIRSGLYVPIRLNRANWGTIAQIPGINRERAEALIELRPFNTNSDFYVALSEYLNANQLNVAAGYLNNP